MLEATTLEEKTNNHKAEVSGIGNSVLPQTEGTMLEIAEGSDLDEKSKYIMQRRIRTHEDKLQQ